MKKTRRVSFDTLCILANSDSDVFAEALADYKLKVLGRKSTDALDKAAQQELVESLASKLDVDIHPDTAEAMQIAENYGYIVSLV